MCTLGYEYVLHVIESCTRSFSHIFYVVLSYPELILDPKQQVSVSVVRKPGFDDCDKCIIAHII